MIPWFSVLLSSAVFAMDVTAVVPEADPPTAIATTTSAEGPAEGENVSLRTVATWLDSVVLLVTGPAWCGGVRIDDRGTVATAYHCIAMGGRPLARTRGGDKALGRVVATDPKNDLALVAVPDLAGKGSFRPIREEPARVGEAVWALGHPFAPAAEGNVVFEGLLQWSLTHGVVSAVGERLIQVDAALNPGNSGGPLLDARGSVIGIASRRLDADNVAFVVPSAALATLIREEPKVRGFGGTWGLGLSGLQGLTPGDVPVVGARVDVAFRDHFVAEAGLDWPLGSRWMALEHGRASWPGATGLVAARLRVGRGKWSTVLDAGGGVMVEEALLGSVSGDRLEILQQPLRPGGVLMGRAALAGAGMRLLWKPSGPEPKWLIGVDIDWPGVLGSF
jgi:S1-C subfamily serine protease